MKNLYSISNEYQLLLDKEEYEAGDIEKIELLDKDMRAKAVQVGAYILNKKAEMLAITMAAENMHERVAVIGRKIKRLMEYLKNELDRCHIDSIDDHPEFTIKLRNNPASVHVTNECEIPREFFTKKESFSLDKRALKEAIENGAEIKGAVIEKSKSLQIK